TPPPAPGIQAHPLRTVDEELRQAAFDGDLERVNALLEQGANVNGRDMYGDTALNQAAQYGHIEVVRRLIEAGADMENLGGAFKTPLMNAAFEGHITVVRFLLEQGARVNSDLLSSIELKVNIFQENAELGMVYPDAVKAWEWFLKLLQLAQLKQI